KLIEIRFSQQRNGTIHLLKLREIGNIDKQKRDETDGSEELFFARAQRTRTSHDRHDSLP
ncbi:MAG: hypothetical protein ABIQ70_10780, partial [Dokdonella sp.]